MISSPEPEFDFGEARSGQVISHTFVLENTGGGILEIGTVRTSCGCTASDVKSRVIVAGESTTLTVKLDLKGRTGPQTQRITVHSNDRTQPQYTLTLKGQAVASVDIKPRTLNFQQINPATPPTGKITIRGTTDEALEIVSVGTTMDRTELRLETVEEGREYHLFITPKDLEGQGNFNDVIEIKTDDSEVPLTRCIVMWQILPKVSVAPRMITLPISRGNDKVNRFIMVRPGEDLEEPLEVTGATWAGREVETNITNTGNFGWRIELRNITPEMSMNEEEVEIHTNVAGFETLKVPVRIIRQ
ncbi:MAG: DUF1573 domain-containing protein [Verrucomicrobia bacterium]|nr:DUF1573 domain-containing protein [Verrucomicrobiota bacterium]MCH8512866.1 DUF1573 domain-containing protein [Kiritimatiellia bacterium]